MSSRDPAHLDASTRERFHLLEARYRRLGKPLRIDVTCTYRGQLEQTAAFADGRSFARAGLSFHNVRDPQSNAPRAYAVDFLLRDDVVGCYLSGRTHADEAEYLVVGLIAEGLGFRWGGRWRRLVDLGHIEAPITIEAAWGGETPAWPPLEEELRPRTGLRLAPLGTLLPRALCRRRVRAGGRAAGRPAVEV
jgi:hypothetical protein